MLRNLAARPLFGLAALLLSLAVLAALYVPSADTRGGAALVLVAVLLVALACVLVSGGFLVAGRRMAARRLMAGALLLMAPFPVILFAVFGMPFTALMLLGATQLGFRNASQDWKSEVEAQWAADRARGAGTPVDPS